MKKNLLLVLCILFLFLIPGCANLPQLTNQSSTGKSNEKVDIDAIILREGKIIILVQRATVHFLKSYSKIYEALGKKEQAEKFMAMANELEASKKDTDKIKEFNGVINNASDELKKIDLEKNLNQELARKYLGESVLNLGVGIFLDGIAVPDAAALLKDAKDAMAKAKANPMTYGPGAVTKLGGVITVATFISSDIPTQVNSVSEVSKKLYEYAKLKGIPVPTQEEINKKAQDLQKE